MKLKIEIFRRGVRMTHRFHEGLEREDPVLGERTFDPGFPISPTQQHSRPLTVQKDGEYRFLDPMSPIVKGGGKLADMNGPAPDWPDPVAQTVPQSTKKRKFP